MPHLPKDCFGDGVSCQAKADRPATTNVKASITTRAVVRVRPFMQ